MVSEPRCSILIATVPVWLKIVCTCRVLLAAHMWGGVLEYQSGVCPILIKFKDLSMYISLLVTPPIVNWFWDGTSLELICMACLFNAQFNIKFNTLERWRNHKIYNRGNPWEKTSYFIGMLMASCTSTNCITGCVSGSLLPAPCISHYQYFLSCTLIYLPQRTPWF